MLVLALLLVVWPFSLAVAALAFSASLRARRGEVLGEVLFEALAPRAARYLALVALGVALVVVLAAGELGRALLALALLGTLARALALLPLPEDQRCGTGGIQYGCDLIRLSELEGWRLTGDHLRVRLRDLWVAVALPRELHPRMRAALEAACPERESVFRD